MKIISDEEVQAINLKLRGRSHKSNPVLGEIRQLSVGQHLLIDANDWKKKTSPSSLIGGTFRDGKKFSVRSIVEGGWIVTRVK